MPTNDLIDRLMAVGSERRIAYRLSGEAELDSVLFGTLPFERDGELTLPEIPGLDAAGLLTRRQPHASRRRGRPAKRIP